jgi:hypothetical protein
MKVVPKVWVVMVGLLYLGCQSEEARQREEAARLVELYAQVKYEAPPEVRTEKLQAIEQAVFVTPEVVGARTICLSGHRQLLEAQRSQDETAAEIDKALVQTDGGGPMAQDAIERLQGTLTRAQGQLLKARAELEDCEARVRALDVRFGKR